MKVGDKVKLIKKDVMYFEYKNTNIEIGDKGVVVDIYPNEPFPIAVAFSKDEEDIDLYCEEEIEIA